MQVERPRGSKGGHRVEPSVTEARVDPVLTVEEVALKLKTTKRQVHNMVSRGQFPAGANVPGLGYRWRGSTLEKWIADALKGAS